MATIGQWVAEAGGVLHKQDLVALGARDRDLTRAVREGEVRRPRRGWYSTFDPRDPRFVAVSVGGRLTGRSALALLGAWIWSTPTSVVVSVPRNASRLRRRRGATVVFDRGEVADRGSLAMVDPRDALVRAVLESSFEEAVALWDWALTSGAYRAAELDEVFELLPHDARGLVTWSDEKSQSILESIARVRLLRLGHDVTSQEPVGRNQSIDLVIDGRIALELDGREFHGESFERDRLKDLTIAIDRWWVFRVSYDMVRRHWRRVVTAIHTALGLHVGRVRPARESPPQKAQQRPVSRSRSARPWVCRDRSRSGRSGTPMRRRAEEVIREA
jgi:very-short-patch-repair endonuclease